MGFPCMCNSLVLPKPITQLIQVICHIRFLIATILFYVGLGSPPEFLPDPFSYHASHFSPFDVPNATTAPINPLVAIKSELRVVEFASLFKKSQGSCRNEEPRCVVCLGWLEAKDEVRELGNCDHAFHKVCIDRWVDAGHVNCPLCRSQLLPHRRKEVHWIQRARFW